MFVQFLISHNHMYNYYYHTSMVFGWSAGRNLCAGSHIRPALFVVCPLAVCMHLTKLCTSSATLICLNTLNIPSYLLAWSCAFKVKWQLGTPLGFHGDKDVSVDLRNRHNYTVMYCCKFKDLSYIKCAEYLEQNKILNVPMHVALEKSNDFKL